MTLWLIVFIILWIITFIPAWKLLLWLSAYSAGKQRLLDIRFISAFILYRLIIIAPYAWLVLAGQEYLSNLITTIIIGFVMTGFLLAVLRFIFRDNFTKLLWQIYAHVYDSLLTFYPYDHLIKKVASHATKREGRILDLGGGTGNVSGLLSDRDIHIVDGSSQMLKKAQKKLAHRENITYQEADIEMYVSHYSGSPYPTIIMNNSLYVVNDRKSFWKNIHSILAQGGEVIISNSDKTGSYSIIKEHIRHKGVASLLKPSLIAVFIIDQLISSLSTTGTFQFVTYEEIEDETKDLFGATFIERCYGGAQDGVNILFILKKR